MESSDLVLLVSMLLALGWSPVAVFFWRAWRRRGAPLSLAITILVLIPIYSNIMSFFFLENDPLWTVISLIIINSFVLIIFGVCFRLQAAAFPDARDEPLPSDPTTRVRKPAKKKAASK